MSSRVRHPMKSFLMFVVLVAGAYFGWKYKHMLEMEPPEHLTAEQRMDIREEVVTHFQENEDFLGFRAMSWRPRESRYFIDIEISDACESPKGLCREIANFIQDLAEVESTVVGVDATGREIGRCVL